MDTPEPVETSTVEAPIHVLATHEGIEGVWPVPAAAIGVSLSAGWTPVATSTPGAGAVVTTEEE